MRDQHFIQISLPIGYGQLPTPEQVEKAKARAAELSQKLEDIGYTVLNPFQFPSREDWTYQHYIEICKYMMYAFRPVMYFDKDWKESNGCREEFDYANKLFLKTHLYENGALTYMRDEFILHCRRQAYYQRQNETYS